MTAHVAAGLSVNKASQVVARQMVNWWRAYATADELDLEQLGCGIEARTMTLVPTTLPSRLRVAYNAAAQRARKI